ncbi:MAG: protein GlxC, partial [Alphaproteobacteria bacterium]
MPTIDLAQEGLRALNQTLQQAARDVAAAKSNETEWTIDNPRGSHAIAVGLDGPLDVTVAGSTGYYCAGMNKEASINVRGSAGPGVAENMMSGTVVIEGDASQYAGATGRGGLLVVKGNAASRCG